ncbi:hypothetical protein Tco_0606149, partial [Tanacetum coccineum]
MKLLLRLCFLQNEKYTNEPLEIKELRKWEAFGRTRNAAIFLSTRTPSSDQILEPLHIDPLLMVKGMPECQNHLHSQGSGGLNIFCSPLLSGFREWLYEAKDVGSWCLSIQQVIQSSPTNSPPSSMSHTFPFPWVNSLPLSSLFGSTSWHVADIYMNGTTRQRKELGYATTWHN